MLPYLIPQNEPLVRAFLKKRNFFQENTCTHILTSYNTHRHTLFHTYYIIYILYTYYIERGRRSVTTLPFCEIKYGDGITPNSVKLNTEGLTTLLFCEIKYTAQFNSVILLEHNFFVLSFLSQRKPSQSCIAWRKKWTILPKDIQGTSCIDLILR
jgi:hypothetical protein